ncbi:MAG: adenylate/guanylate cyclase domain-containing protein [Nitrospirae bacterium]|nr:adenylate/guanylate cyclase domain-containing protein [Nitrospirota bacterium]
MRESASRFTDELILYSGQYALFYILMNFSMDFLNYFRNFGHTMLLLILFVQTTILARYGSRGRVRFFGSLIAPLIYTLVEIREGSSFIFNTGHIFFWVFSIITGALQAVAAQYPGGSRKKIIEALITTTNVIIFIFLYFYFDLKLSAEKQYAAGNIGYEAMRERLDVFHLLEGFRAFLSDPAHIYIIFGGLILSLSLSIGRIRIITLKERINELFGRYVDNNFRDEILRRPSNKSSRKKLCILFADIRGFTGISETYEPEAVTEMLNLYFTAWEQTATAQSGIIDKYIGDAIMVIFGVKSLKDPCGLAVASATEMLRRLPEIQQALKERELPVIKDIGIGIHYGDIIIGDIGSRNRLNYTVIGDNVNIAARIESLCKKYTRQLIVSESVFESLGAEQQVLFDFLDKTALKGKKGEIAVYSAHP